ncbi:MAG: hypothetical protein LBL00_05235 [Endomicrobium sp.]|jgi:hypothetical protein|nr:hypothetical protein [Endomicrobium sp.]
MKFYIVNKIIAVICASVLLLGLCQDHAISSLPQDNAIAENQTAYLGFPYAKITSYAGYLSDTFVINIQDYHGDYDTQKAISGLLEKIYDCGKKIEIYLEGAYTQLDLSYLDGIKQTPDFAGFADTLLKNGKITGAELFSLKKDNIKLNGLEELDVYLENLKRLYLLLSNKDDILSEFEFYYKDINRKILKTLTPAGRKLYGAKQKYDAAKTDGAKYTSALLKHASENNIDVKKAYPNVYKSGRMYRLGAKINFKKANSDMPLFLNFVKSVLSYKDYLKIENSENKISALGKIYRDHSFKTPALTAFFEYAYCRDTLNRSSLLKEEDELFWTVMDMQCSGNFQKREVEYLRVLDYSKKLLLAEIVSYEYDRLVKSGSMFESSFYKYFGISLPEHIKKYYELSKEFYAVNEQRNIIFAGKAGVIKDDEEFKYKYEAADMSAAFFNASVVKILVTGGYHSEGLTKILRQNGVPYVVFTPEIFSVNEKTKDLYEHSINMQAKAVFSAFQKFLNFQNMIISGGNLDIRKFCDIMLDYDTVKFLDGQKESGNDIMERFTEGLVKQINGAVSAQNRIKSLNIDVISKTKNSYEIVITAESANGGIVKVYHNSIDAAKILDVRNPFKTAIKTIFSSVPSSKPAKLIFETYKAKAERCAGDFDLQLQFCKNNPETADLEIIAPQILQNAAALMETIKNLDKIYPDLDYVRQYECERIITQVSEKYFGILSSGAGFGNKTDSLLKTSQRLQKLISEFGLEAHEDMNARFGAIVANEVIAKSPKKTSREIEKNVMRFFARGIDSLGVSVFAFASAQARETLGKEYDEDAADMIFIMLKERFFRKNSIKRAGSPQVIINALTTQSREILPYFMEKNFSVENQEEVEDVLVRSLAALEIIESYPQYAQIEEIIRISEELFTASSGKIDIKTSENAYLEALENNDMENLETLKKELDDKMEYARRVTVFQSELIKVIAKLGEEDAVSSKAARDFLLKVADGSILKGDPETEGMYWLRQQSVLRLKNFNSPQTVLVLEKIIESENSGELPSADSVFMSVNLDASNTKTLSLKLHCAGVLIDFKRQDAKKLLQTDINAYFEILKTLPAKDRFAYISAAADIIADSAISSESKISILKNFALAEDKNILFSANILLDFAAKEFSASKSSDITDFVEAFVSALAGFSGKDLSHINDKIKILKTGDKRSGAIMREVISEIRFTLGNLGSGNVKTTDWLSDYNVFIISGGSVTEEIVRLENMDFSGKTVGLMSPNDDGGSTLLCRGYNADKNGIYSIAQGDVVSFITSAAALDVNDAPLKKILKDLMNTRFDEDEPLVSALEKLKSVYEEKIDASFRSEFTVFWDKLEKYAAICDAAGFSIINNSLKNLIFEAIAIDNKGYGEGFINPDGIYAAMKDFADLMGTKSVAVSNLPYGNITTVTTKGGIEYIGQSYFSHTPHVLNGGRARNFWTAQNIGETFEPAQIESAAAKGLKRAKLIIAGLCSWVTSLGVQIANPDIAAAVAENEGADKILIANPVKDDENVMTWSESTVAFVQRISKRRFQKMFNTVFAWQPSPRDIKVSSVNLTEKDVFDGKAGGYRGENAISVSGSKLLDKLKIKFHVLSDIDIHTVARRDDASKNNYKIIANPQTLAGKVLSSLSRTNSKILYANTTLAVSENIKNSRLADSTALFFGDGNHEALRRADTLLEYGASSFVFVPLPKSEIEKMKLENRISSIQSYGNLSMPVGFGEENPIFFAVENNGDALSTKCYYAAETSGEKKAVAENLAQWFKNEIPTLAADKLLKYEQVSVIESTLPEMNFDDFAFEGSPLKILINGIVYPSYDFTVDAARAADAENYVDTLLGELRKPVYDISYKFNQYKSFGEFGDKKNETLLAELKKLMISIDAWDDVAKRAAVIYAVKSGFEAKVTKKGVQFVSPEGKTALFYVDAAGKFQATESFMRKMNYLAGLRVFADMDDNIAPRAEPFGSEMKNVFAGLTLYGICNPVIITGNTDETLWLRLRELPESVLEETVFYTETGGLRYAWHKTIDEDGNESAGFAIDEDYLEDISQAKIPLDVKKKMRELTSNVDYQFDDLFVSFVRNTNAIDNYTETASAALSAYSENHEMIKLLKKIINIQGSKNILIISWQSLSVSNVQNIMNGLFDVYKYGQINEEQYLDALKIVSLLEYSRISFSARSEDEGNKNVILAESERAKILKGEYVKNNADSEVRISLTPIRVKHIKNMIADLYADKFSHIPEFSEYKVESSGRTTINIMKQTCRKDIPIGYEIDKMSVPSGNIMYSGDEVFLSGMSPSNAGIDDSVAVLGLKKRNAGMFVVNTNLNEHDTAARPNLIWLADVMRRNGISVNSPVDAGTLLHEKILERLEYNLENIALDENFEPENIVQLLKKTVNGGFVEYPLIKDFTPSVNERSNAPVSAETILSLLSAA